MLKTLLKRVYYSLYDVFTSKKGVPVNISNFNLKLPVRYRHYYPEQYEKENFDFIKKHCVPGMTCIDIGAHFGLFSVLMHEQTKNKVYSFEPTPSTVAILKETIKINGASENVKVKEAAVADKPGKATFYVSASIGSVENSLVKEHHLDPNFNGYEVELIALDDFVTENNIIPSFIKIDAEGAEALVLKGAMNTLRKFRPIMILGLHPKAFLAFNATHEVIWDMLMDCRYDVFFEGNLQTKKQFCDNNSVFDVHLIPSVSN